jgi:hypothetical protein
LCQIGIAILPAWLGDMQSMEKFVDSFCVRAVYFLYGMQYNKRNPIYPAYLLEKAVETP